jgi:hypothetical protein
LWAYAQKHIDIGEPEIGVEDAYPMIHHGEADADIKHKIALPYAAFSGCYRNYPRHCSILVICACNIRAKIPYEK